MRTKSAPLQSSLPAKVGGFELISLWEGQKRWPGHNWLVRCVSCKESRLVNTGMWNAAHKGKHVMKCDCLKFKTVDGREAKVRLTFNNESMTVAEWANRTGLPASSIYARLARRDARGTPFPDEWVIFGTDKDNPIRKAPKQDIDADVRKAIKAIEDEVISVLRPAFIDAVNRLVHEKITPLLMTLRNQAGSVTVTKEEPKVIPEGYLISMDGESYYNPAPHPNDDVLVAKETTYRRAREFFGDESTEEIYWPERELFLQEDLYIRHDDLEAEAERFEQERRDHEAAEKRRKAEEDAKQYIHCLPGHYFALWRESERKFKPSDNPTPEAFPKQEDTDPLTDAEVAYYLDTPWWVRRVRRPHYIYNFGPICRTMYERIKAFHIPPQKQYPLGPDYAVMFRPAYQYCDSHRNLNDYLDWFAICEWCDTGRLIPSDIDNHMEALTHRFVNWSESEQPKIQQQAHRLVNMIPALRGYIEANYDGYVTDLLPEDKESSLDFLDRDTADVSEIHDVLSRTVT